MSRRTPEVRTIRYPNHGPIAPDCWRPGDYSYSNLLNVIAERVRAIKHPLKQEMAHVALLARATTHANRNYEHVNKVIATMEVDELQRYSDVIGGGATTPEYVQFLHDYPMLRSVEDARLIHPGDWDVREAIDDPVRESLLDPAHALGTEERAVESHYKILQFNDSFHMVTFDRKRNGMMIHFGGQVLTTIRNTLIIDPAHAPQGLRDYIFAEREKARHTDYDYGAHHGRVKEELEHHLRERDMAEKPRWAIPLMTTYYSVMNQGDDAKED